MAVDFTTNLALHDAETSQDKAVNNTNFAILGIHFDDNNRLSQSIIVIKVYNKLHINTLSLTGSILSNTDLSDLSTVGTCDIFVYQMRYRVM